MNLLLISLGPVFIIALYISYRDKYEKEPLGILLKSLFAGAIITIPIIWTERFLGMAAVNLTGLGMAAYTAFIVAAFTEEIFKFLALYLLIWKNRNFNEKFDGIVYASFVSLGFAAVENVLYVSQGGGGVALARAFTAVPAHAIFGIVMGYYFGLARFSTNKHVMYIFFAITIPILFHGMYDFILMSQHPKLLVLFTPFLIFMYINGFRRMKKINEPFVF